MPTSHLVTPEMREAWFNREGWYADDDTILKWYKEVFSSEKQRRKSHANSIQVKGESK